MAAGFLRRHLRAVTISAATVATLGAGVTTAFAQDCFIANRSLQGAQMVSHSSQWFTIDVNAFLVAQGACAAQVQAVDAALTAAGLPLITATRTDTTLPDNGHGIQHLDDTYFPILEQVLSTVGC